MSDRLLEDALESAYSNGYQNALSNIVSDKSINAAFRAFTSLKWSKYGQKKKLIAAIKAAARESKEV